MRFLDEYKKDIDNHEIISFDIFDTLLFRPYLSFTDLYNYIEKVYNVKNFSKIRRKAEKQARKLLSTNNIEDISITDIYNNIPNNLKYLKEIELNLEKHQTILNKEMFDVYNYAIEQNKKVIIISDMYLDKTFLVNLLKSKGIDKFEELYVSSDIKKLKSTGNLFKYVLAQNNFVANKVLHIGDNLKSDVQMAKQNKIDAIHYERVLDKFINFYPSINNILRKYKNNLAMSIFIMLNAIYWNNNNSYWKNFGYLYTAFSCLNYAYWIKKNVIKQGIDNIIFIARDGYLLEKIYNKLFNKEQLKTYYVYAPRLINLCITLDLKNKGKYSEEHNRAVINYYKTKSDIINSISQKELDNSKYMVLEKYINELEKLKNSEVSNYTKYLSNFNISGKNIGIVDSVSKFFSAQKMISSILKDKKFYGFYYQIQKKANLKGINVKSYKPIQKYSKDCRLIEFTMSAPTPSIISIKNNEPLFKDLSEKEQVRINKFKDIEEGCLSFIDDIKKYFGENFPYELLTDKDVTFVLLNLVKNPTQRDKDNFKDVLFAYDTSHNNYRELFPKWYKKKFNILNFLKFLK